MIEVFLTVQAATLGCVVITVLLLIRTVGRVSQRIDFLSDTILGMLEAYAAAIERRERLADEAGRFLDNGVFPPDPEERTRS